MEKFSSAIVTIVGIAPYSQSHRHDDDLLEGESPDAYDKRTWRSKMNTMPTGKKKRVDGKDVTERTVVIPAFAIHHALMEAARYSKKQIPGQGKATWTAKVTSGLAMMGPAPLNVDPDEVESITISAHADGRRGSGRRVLRRFPQVPAGWRATFELIILDPILTEEVLTEIIQNAGLFKGLGQYRPENGGSNGRFQLEKIEWVDNRQLIAKKAA